MPGIMGYNNRQVVNLVLLALCLFMICGCATIKIETFDPDVYPTKIPVRIGAYIPSAFRNYVQFMKGGDRVEIGDGLSRGAERVFREVFKEVVVIEGVGADLRAEEIDAVISPEMVETDLMRGTVPGSEVAVTCKWTVVNPKGRTYYMNTITGVGTDSSLLFIARTTKSSTRAVEDHYRKLIQHMLFTKW